MTVVITINFSGLWNNPKSKAQDPTTTYSYNNNNDKRGWLRFSNTLTQYYILMWLQKIPKFTWYDNVPKSKHGKVWRWEPLLQEIHWKNHCKPKLNQWKWWWLLSMKSLLQYYISLGKTCKAEYYGPLLHLTRLTIGAIPSCLLCARATHTQKVCYYYE